MSDKQATGHRAVVLVVLMLTATMAGCIGDGDGDGAEVEQTRDQPSNRTGPSGPVQESSAAWVTGESCGGVSPTNVGTTDGVNHDVIDLAAEALGQPFNAAIASEQAPVTWSIIFYGGFPPQPMDSYEASGDEIEGDVPDESDWFAVVTSCGGLDHEVQFTVMGGGG